MGYVTSSVLAKNGTITPQYSNVKTTSAQSRSLPQAAGAVDFLVHECVGKCLNASLFQLADLFCESTSGFTGVALVLPTVLTILLFGVTLGLITGREFD